MIKCLVFSGGSFKGLSFIGVIKYIEEQKLCQNINTYYGTSIGAITAALLSIGYTSAELKYCITKLDLEQLIDLTSLNINTFLESFGLLNPNKLYQLLELLIEKKTKIKNITFKQHYQKYNKKLVITGSNISKIKCIYFDYLNHPDMLILDAIKISSCIPFIFKPIQFNDDFYVDGALYDNYPIVDACKYFNHTNVLGFHLLFDYKPDNKIETIEDYLKYFIISIIININTLPDKKYNDITVDILHKDVNVLRIKPEDMEDIILLGYNSMCSYYENNRERFHDRKITLQNIDYTNDVLKKSNE
jgi:predicted acylesterase/phospholipase RssA